jgi:hypothetical protein
MGQCSDQVAEWVELNRRFHEILTKACGSRRLIEMLKGLRDAAAVYVVLGTRTVPGHICDSGNADHQALFTAFRRQRSRGRGGYHCAPSRHDARSRAGREPLTWALTNPGRVGRLDVATQGCRTSAHRAKCFVFDT